MAARRSLGLTAFLAAAARGSGRPYASQTRRPDGLLVWVHVSSLEKKLAAQQLAERLQSQRDEVRILMTGPNRESRDSSAQSTDPDLTPLPDDMVQSTTAFLDHWRPDLCLWVGGDLQPCLLALSAERNVPMVLIDPTPLTMRATPRFWARLLPSKILPLFTTILTDSKATSQALMRKGAGRGVITAVGEFEDGSRLLSYDADYRAKLAAKLHNRSVWMAAGVQRSELQVVLAAHRRILQFSLRSVLVLLPGNLDDIDAIYADITAAGMRVIRSSDGYSPEESTQVILADEPEDLGVWYRLAPVCFLGTSLKKDMLGRDPNEPAAHGAAIISGAFVARYETTFDRYRKANAARMVANDQELAAAVKELMLPDKSAAMAQAAWDVASRGAQVMDRILELSHDLLDTVEAL